MDNFLNVTRYNIEQIRALLISRPRDCQYTDIAEAIGVSVKWLANFAKGRVKDPPALKLATLHEFLIDAHKKSKQKIYEHGGGVGGYFEF